MLYTYRGKRVVVNIIHSVLYIYMLGELILFAIFALCFYIYAVDKYQYMIFSLFSFHRRGLSHYFTYIKSKPD